MDDSHFRLLLIEDEKNLAGLLQEELERVDVSVHWESNGDLGLAAFADQFKMGQTFDAILCDLNLPGQSGLQVLASIKAIHPTTPFILLTAFADKPRAIEALRLGAFDLLEKPFEVDRLKQIVLKSLHLGREILTYENDLQQAAVSTNTPILDPKAQAQFLQDWVEHKYK